MSDLYHYALAAVHGQPLLVSQARLDQVLAYLETRVSGGGDPAPENSPSSPSAAAFAVEMYQTRVGTRVDKNGIAVIPIHGTMLRRGGFMDAMSGVTSYTAITRDVHAAFADPEVRGVMLDMDTPGGEAGGVFDLAEGLAAMRAESGKPLWSIANETSLSGGYAIAASTDMIWIPRTGVVGSIGVVAAHRDQSKADAMQGHAYTYIYAGDHKIDGNPHEPLPSGVKSDLQEDIDELYGMFVAHVAAARGLAAETVEGTQARIYRAERAVSVGLADRVGTLADALSAMARELDRPASQSATQKGGGAAAIPNRKESAMADASANSAADATPAATTSGAVAPVTDATAAPATTAVEPESEAATASAPGTPEAAVAVAANAGKTITVDAAADMVEAAQVAAKAGVDVDVVTAIREGQSAFAVKAAALDVLASRSEAADVVTARPVPAGGKADNGWDTAFKTKK